MSIIYIVSGNSLETFYNDTLDYLFERYHPHAPEDANHTLSPEMEESAMMAEGWLLDTEANGEL